MYHNNHFQLPNCRAELTILTSPGSTIINLKPRKLFNASRTPEVLLNISQQNSQLLDPQARITWHVSFSTNAQDSSVSSALSSLQVTQQALEQLSAWEAASRAAIDHPAAVLDDIDHALSLTGADQIEQLCLMLALTPNAFAAEPGFSCLANEILNAPGFGAAKAAFIDTMNQQVRQGVPDDPVDILSSLRPIYTLLNKLPLCSKAGKTQPLRYLIALYLLEQQSTDEEMQLLTQFDPEFTNDKGERITMSDYLSLLASRRFNRLNPSDLLLL